MLPAEVGIIADGKVTIGKRLTIALVQTLAKVDLSTLTDKFGAIFIDEAHHLAADTFYKTVDKFPALYRLWASATPEREDGLSRAVYAVGGPILYEIDPCDLPTITPKLLVIETDFNYRSEDYPELMKTLVKDVTRNDLIVEKIVQNAEGHYSLVLSDRKEHLDTLRQLLAQAAPNLRIEILTGSVSKGNRKAIMERMKLKEIDVLLATQLAREGLDIPHLDRLFLATPKKSGTAIQQEVGRIMRPCDGKQTAMVFDFWNTKSPILKTQFWARRKVYVKLGVKVELDIKWIKPTKMRIVVVG